MVLEAHTMGVAPVELHRHRLRRSTIVACSMMLNASQGLPAPEQRSRQVLAMAFARGMTIDPPESWSQSHAGIVRIQTKPTLASTARHIRIIARGCCHRRRVVIHLQQSSHPDRRTTCRYQKLRLVSARRRNAVKSALLTQSPDEIRCPFRKFHPSRFALIMSWCSASGTFGTCWDHTKDITMTLARTYR